MLIQVDSFATDLQSWWHFLVLGAVTWNHLELNTSLLKLQTNFDIVTFPQVIIYLNLFGTSSSQKFCKNKRLSQQADDIIWYSIVPWLPCVYNVNCDCVVTGPSCRRFRDFGTACHFSLQYRQGISILLNPIVDPRLPVCSFFVCLYCGVLFFLSVQSVFSVNYLLL